MGYCCWASIRASSYHTKHRRCLGGGLVKQGTAKFLDAAVSTSSLKAGVGRCGSGRQGRCRCDVLISHDVGTDGRSHQHHILLIYPCPWLSLPAHLHIDHIPASRSFDTFCTITSPVSDLRHIAVLASLAPTHQAMSDALSSRASVRSSTFLNRPHIAPMGPRTRQTSLRASHILDNGFAIASPSPTGLDLPEFGDVDVPMSPMRLSAPSSPRSLEASIHSSHRSLAVLEEEPPSPEPETTPAYISNDYVSVEEPSQTPQVKVVAVVPPPKLVPPPAIKFETTPITWKGLPMEAALCMSILLL